MRTPAIRDRLCGRKPGRTAAHRGKPFGQKTARRSPGHKSKPNSRLAAIIPYFPCFGEPGMAPGLAFFAVPAPLSHTVNIHCLAESIFSRPFRHRPCSPPIAAFPINPRIMAVFLFGETQDIFLEKSLKKELTTGHSGDMIQKEYSSFMYKFTAEGSRWKW